MLQSDYSFALPCFLSHYHTTNPIPAELSPFHQISSQCLTTSNSLASLYKGNVSHCFEERKVLIQRQHSLHRISQQSSLEPYRQRVVVRVFACDFSNVVILPWRIYKSPVAGSLSPYSRPLSTTIQAGVDCVP